MTRNPKEGFVAQKWRQLTGGVSSDDAVPATDLTQQMRQASLPSSSFFLMLGLAAAIATFGLIANSAPAIIGAMIIAPLMNPIMSLSYGLVVFTTGLIIRSIVTVSAGVILVLMLAYLITLAFGLRITGSEILNRTNPTLIDLGVAMAAGGAAAYANTLRSIISSIAGVAIAVALVPPLAVCGIGLALGHTATAEFGLSLSEFGLYSGGADIALGAFLLFFTNFVGIVAVAILVFSCQRYGQWKRTLLALPLFLALSALLVQPLGAALHELYAKNRVVRLIAKLPHTRPDIISGESKLDSINVAYREGILHVNIKGFVHRDLVEEGLGGTNLQERVDLFREYLSSDIGEPVVVEFDVITVDMVRVISKLPEPRAGEQERNKTNN